MRWLSESTNVRWEGTLSLVTLSICTHAAETPLFFILRNESFNFVFSSGGVVWKGFPPIGENFENFFQSGKSEKNGGFGQNQGKIFQIRKLHRIKKWEPCFEHLQIYHVPLLQC